MSRRGAVRTFPTLSSHPPVDGVETSLATADAASSAIQCESRSAIPPTITERATIPRRDTLIHFIHLP